ncbi:hypothetical protein E1B28_012551 [Marasmius oreades]|uniref:Sugar phosphate transporter domain-containing protein n=1 Tax=Marasmius oreades TaxID=181124 RepID=A0A9P7RRZ3_9AGAR|nr:uncharacterized protein E1B28_012551 [Marasmius oreades]KAG7088572.1 hypothetical protein E1B28_012551 [Marasmius oreades]
MAVSLQVVGVVSFYMVAALIMVFVNKLVLNAAPNLTVLFMFFQSTTTVVLLILTSFLTPLVQLPQLSLSAARNLTPLIIVDTAGFVFNALCLRDVEAAFYQIARGMVLPLTILVVSCTSRQAPSLKVVGCATIVTLGFFIGTSFPAGLPAKSVMSPTALFYGFLSSMSIALHAVLVKSSLPYVNGNPTMLSFWSNLGSALLLGALSLLKGEVVEFMGMTTKVDWDWNTFLWGNIVTGVFGFLISIAGILSVKVTSPVTHMFSSAARSVLQVFLGVKLFGDVFTTQRAMSVFTILVGTLLYTYIKTQEPKAAPASVLPTTKQDAESQAKLLHNEKEEG